MLSRNCLVTRIPNTNGDLRAAPFCPKEDL